MDSVQIYGVVSVVSGMAAIWSIMILSMERAWVVYRVTRGRQARLGHGVVRSIVITQWLLAIVAALPPLVGYNRSVFSTLIGRTTTILCSHWWRASMSFHKRQYSITGAPSDAGDSSLMP